MEPAAVGGVAAPRPNIGLATIDGEMAPSSFGEVSEMRLSREELLKNSGLTEDQLVELEGYGLIAPRGRHYDGDALAIAKAVTEMGGFFGNAGVFSVTGVLVTGFKGIVRLPSGWVLTVTTSLGTHLWMRPTRPMSLPHLGQMSAIGKLDLG